MDQTRAAKLVSAALLLGAGAVCFAISALSTRDNPGIYLGLALVAIGSLLFIPVDRLRSPDPSEKLRALASLHPPG